MKKNDKLISIQIPCYNEVGNVRRMAETLIEIMDKMEYSYRLFFVDNCSEDGTQDVLRQICKEHKQVKAIMNMRNYGVIDGRSFKNAEKYNNNADVYISIACDFQEPPELIPEFIKCWEEGYKVVCGQKVDSKEGKLKYSLRQLFYKIIQSQSDIEQYKNMSGIILLDKDIRKLMDSVDKEVDFRYAIADTGYKVKFIPYIQNKRASGKSSYNVFRYLSFAINSLVNTSTKPLRTITIVGFLSSVLCIILAVLYLIIKLLYWYNFDAGVAPIIISVLFVGSVQMFILGVIGEYLGVLVKKNTRYPDVVLSEKLNLDDED